MTNKFWKADRTVYYCYDEISGTNWSGKHGPEYEKSFMREVDLVVTSSKKLQEKKSFFNENCQLVPNGVNLDIFQSIAQHHSKTRSIGYIGAIDERIDFELIVYLQEQLPNHKFDFYGNKNYNPEAIEKFETDGTVPEYARTYRQYGFVYYPIHKGDLTSAIYPLKSMNT